MPPITPKEAQAKHIKTIPEAVFEVFNKLLAEQGSRGSITIRQPDVLAALRKTTVNVDEAFEKGWLDIEPFYRKAGWKVVYDSPAYCETYEAFWVFSRKVRR